MPDSVRPHRRHPTRLPCPWDSPGKNAGVGCHFLLQCMKVKSESEVAQLRPHGLQPTRLLRPWDFPGKSTGVGCHCLLHLVVLGSIKDTYGRGTGRHRERKEQAQSHQEQEDLCVFVAVPLIVRLVEYLITRVTLYYHLSNARYFS